MYVPTIQGAISICDILLLNKLNNVLQLTIINKPKLRSNMSVKLFLQIIKYTYCAIKNEPKISTSKVIHNLVFNAFHIILSSRLCCYVTLLRKMLCIKLVTISVFSCFERTKRIDFGNIHFSSDHIMWKFKWLDCNQAGFRIKPAQLHTYVTRYVRHIVSSVHHKRLLN